jgi:hypothetical protein
MATCDMGYDHEAGPAVPAEPAQEVILTEPPTNEHDVAIAEADAAARIATEEAYAASRDPEKDAEIARLRGELDGMREALARLQPPEPEPAPEPEPEPAITVEEVGEPAPPEDKPQPAEPAKAKKRDYWAAYR